MHGHASRLFLVQPTHIAAACLAYMYVVNIDSDETQLTDPWLRDTITVKDVQVFERDQTPDAQVARILASSLSCMLPAIALQSGSGPPDLRPEM